MKIRTRFVLGMAAAMLSGFLLAIGILLINSGRLSNLDLTPPAGVVLEVTHTPQQQEGASIIDALTGNMGK